MNKKSSYLFILIGIVFLLPAIFPLFHKGFFLTDDGEWMIIRFTSFYQAVHDGQFPVRFLQRLNFDYGYPVATFLYPGFMYAGVLLHVLKIGFVDTIKIILGISLFGTTLFTYLWLSKVFTKKSAAFFGAFASLYIPYHLYDVYTRGSVGEIFALMWVPFIFWMIETKNIFFLSIGIFLLILSHNTLALLFLPILFLYALLRKVFPLKQLLFSFLSGVLLSAFFIIPILFELPLTVFSQTNVSEPTHYFADVHLIGISTIILSLFALVLFIAKNKFLPGQRMLIRLFLIVTFLALFFSSSLSSSLWQIIPASFVQFPFRFLSYLIISLAFLTAFVVSEMHTFLKKVLVIGTLTGVTIFSSFPFMMPKEYFDKGDGYYATNDATTTVRDEYMPMWVTQKPTQRPKAKVEVESVGESSISHLFSNNKQITFDLHLQRDANVFINTLYWPGWKVYVDNWEDALAFDNPKGVIRFNLSGGEHKVRAEFGETTLRLFADAVSLLSFAVLAFVSFKKRKKII